MEELEQLAWARVATIQELPEDPVAIVGQWREQGMSAQDVKRSLALPTNDMLFRAAVWAGWARWTTWVRDSAIHRSVREEECSLETVAAATGVSVDEVTAILTRRRFNYDENGVQTSASWLDQVPPPLPKVDDPRLVTTE